MSERRIYPADSLSLDLGGRDIALWALAAMLVLSAHLASAWYLQRMPPALPASAQAAPAIMMDLAPMMTAPDAARSDVAETVNSATADPVEEPTEKPEPAKEPAALEAARDEPVEKAEAAEAEPLEEQAPQPAKQAEEVVPDLQEAPLPEVALAIPQPRPVAKKPVEEPVKKPAPKPAKKKTVKVERKAPPPQMAAVKTAEKAAKEAAPRVKITAAGTGVSPARWQSRVNAHLNRYKRYPNGGHGRGTVTVRFTINESGGVTSAALSGSSGDAAFDTAALDLVRRASPVPAPPPEIARPRMSLVVPIYFSR
jgi:protein TonB